jgi:hypothetical protein
MRPECAWCGLDFRREPGFYLGSIYVNYGLTAVLITAGYLGLFAAEVISPQALLYVMAPFCVVFPLWFFRYARSLWLGFDQYWDPDPDPSEKPSP